MTQQGFSKLRSKFSHKPFELILNKLVSEEYSGRFPTETWNGLHVLAIDGSYLQLPNAPEVKELFGTRGEGHQCVCAGISVLFDVLSGWVLHPIITHSNMNERDECMHHISFLCENLAHIVPNSLLLLDRGYPSRKLLQSMEKAKLNYLLRCSRTFVPKAPMGDSVVRLKDGFTFRVFKFVSPGGETETLATNLSDTPQEDLVKLYHKRWRIETLYGKLKNIVCVENFSGRTPNTVLQDFWASMVLINSVAVFQKEADAAIARRNGSKELKHEYQAKTSDMVVTLRDRFIFACLRRSKILGSLQMSSIIKTLARSVSPIRPHRSFPRHFAPHAKFDLNLKSHL